jgi:membrane associated rhomboid family serine protease
LESVTDRDYSPQVPPGYPFEEPKPPFAWVTWSIVATTVAVFLLQLWRIHVTRDDSVADTLAFSRQALEEHRYYTVLTYAWVHATALFDNSRLFWLHIVANMIPMICLGPALEEMLGHLRFLGLYVGGAIAAVLFWYVLNLHSDDPIIGASGAVFAVVAAIGTLAPRARVTVFLFYVLPLRMTMGAVAILACGIELAQIIFGWMPELAHSAHLGGAAFGFFYALAFRRRSYHI